MRAATIGPERPDDRLHPCFAGHSSSRNSTIRVRSVTTARIGPPICDRYWVTTHGFRLPSMNGINRRRGACIKRIKAEHMRRLAEEHADTDHRKYAYDFDYRMHGYILRQLEDRMPTGRALELGCYHGEFTRHLE